MSAVIEERIVRPKLKRPIKVRGEQAERARLLEQMHDSGLTKDIVEDEVCRRSLSDYVQRTFYSLIPGIEYKSNWHVDLICEYLQAVHDGEILRLLVNIPPRFLKSLICSVAFPSWLLGLDPRERLLCASYDSSLALDLSVKCRRVMNTDWYKRMFQETRFSEDQNEKRKYETTRQGFRICTSVGASATGFGGRYKILDDPIDPKGVFSKAELEACVDWMDQTWSSRQDDPQATREVVIMQRLHPHDPTAHLLQQGGWEMLKLSQEEEEKRTVITFPKSARTVVRERGDILHPEYFSKTQVQEAKNRLGPYGYQAQQQQKPVASGGGRIKIDWFPRYLALPASPDEVIASADTASKKKEANAKSCIGIFVRKGIQWHLSAVESERWIYPELKRNVLGLHGKHKPDAWLIEDKSSGTALIQDLLSSTQIPVIAIEPVGDKVARMDRGIAFIASGRIALPDQMRISPIPKWLFDVEQTLAAFPALLEADFIDMLSQFIEYVKAMAGDGQGELLVSVG